MTAIEVAEHLYEEDSDLFFDHLCSWGDQVVFSSTDDDYDEPTHVNVQKIEYWTKKFAQRGFYRDFSSDLSYLTRHAVCFVRQEKRSPIALAEDYERLLRTKWMMRRSWPSGWRSWLSS